MGRRGVLGGRWALLLLMAVCCGGTTGRATRADAETGGTTGGADATSGGARAGETMGGAEPGGGAAGAAPSAGAATGGAGNGGLAVGGALTGGLASGGIDLGGAATGGLAIAGTSTGGVATGGAAAGGEGGRTPSCAALAAALAERLPTDRVATIVVRVAYQADLPLLGYQILPGDYLASEPTEQEARAAVLDELGWGDELGPLTTEPGEQGYFVFYDRGPDAGTVAVVSNDTGQVVFGGEVRSEGRGELVLPSTWRPPEELGDCPTEGPGPSSTWLPTEIFSFPISAVDRVWDTALPEAMELAVGGVHRKRLALLLYPRTYDGTADEELEYVVFWFYDYV